MRLALLLAAAILCRHPTGKWAGDPLSLGLNSSRKQVYGYCCAEADGHVLDDGEWDTKDNNYRVFVQGEWGVVRRLTDAALFGQQVWQGNSLVQGSMGRTPIPEQRFLPGSGV